VKISWPFERYVKQNINTASRPMKMIFSEKYFTSLLVLHAPSGKTPKTPHVIHVISLFTIPQKTVTHM